MMIKDCQFRTVIFLNNILGENIFIFCNLCHLAVKMWTCGSQRVCTRRLAVRGSSGLVPQPNLWLVPLTLLFLREWQFTFCSHAISLRTIQGQTLFVLVGLGWVSLSRLDRPSDTYAQSPPFVIPGSAVTIGCRESYNYNNGRFVKKKKPNK